LEIVMTTTSHYALRSLLLAAAVSTCLSAQGQTAQTSESVSLETITVTARKTEESIVDVPLAVTAITAAEIESAGIKDIEDVATFSPGFRFQNQSVGRNDRGFKQYVIRGMVPNSALATRQAVTLFVDGAPVAGGNISGVTDIERIEVVKGPQSAFFGRSTFAGAINFITREPSFDWGGSLSAEVASWDTTEINASVEGPLVDDKLAFRLAGRSYSTGGDYTNYNFPGSRLGERETQSLSLSLLATPTDNLKIRLFGTAWRDDDGFPRNATFSRAYQNCAAGAAGATINYYCGGIDKAPVDTRTYNTYIDRVALEYLQGYRGNGITLHGPEFLTHLGLKREAYQARANIEYSLPGDYLLTAIAAYGLNKWGFLQTQNGVIPSSVPNPSYGTIPDVLPYNYSLVLGNTQDRDKSLEVRLSSPADGRLSWSVGANYAFARTDNLTTVFGNTGYIAGTPHTINSSDTLGLFGSVAYEFVDGWTAIVEGRYQEDKLFQQTLAGTSPSFESTFYSFTPRVIVEYEPVDDVTVYVSYAEGNRPGEFNTIYFAQTPEIQQQIATQANVQGAVPEDEIKMYELGLRGMFFDNRLRLLANVYHGRWTNRHIPNYVYFFDANNLLQSIQVTAPNGVVDVQGIELEGSFQATRSLRFDWTFNIAETEILRTFCTDCSQTTGNAEPTGTQLPYYPKISGTLSGTYTFDLFNFAEGSLRIDYIYTGKQYETEANLAWTEASSKVNVRLGATWDNYTVELFGTNVFDDDTPTSLARGSETIYNPAGVSIGNTNTVVVSLPDRATFGIRAAVKF
jgi:iron complex outermembrane receptor protein